jgi:hypothetical protein
VVKAKLRLSVYGDPTPLPEPPARYTVAHGINNLGQIVGNWRTSFTYPIIWGAGGPPPPPPSPVQLLQSLVDLTVAMNLSALIANRLDAKLAGARAALDAARENSSSTGANQLGAFVPPRSPTYAAGG